MVLTRLISVGTLALSAIGAHADPFQSADYNPLLGGLTLIAPARLLTNNQTSLQLALNWSSTAAIQQSANEALIVDAEIHEWRFSIDRAFGNRFQARIQLPYRTINGGSLDSLIEHWHSFFGLPRGDRPALPRNQVRIDYIRNGANRLLIRDASRSGMGDISIDMGYRLQAEPNRATSLWSSITLPTGDADSLMGNGALTGTLAVAHTRSFERIELFGHGAVTFRSRGGPLSEQQKSVVWQAMIGSDYRATDRFTVRAQLDGHGATFSNTGLAMMNAAYILTFGGEYALRNRWRAQFGVSEDIKVEASPDVTFAMSVAKRLK